MLMIVDFPAPFSPITPWMLPRRTVRETSLLAWFVPNHLLTLPSSRAGGRISLGRLPGDRLRKSPCTMVSLPRLSVIPPPPIVQRFRLLLIGLNLEFARDDLGLGGLDLLLHVVGDQRLVVVVEGIADAILLETEDPGARGPGAVLGRFHAVVDRDIDALDHGGQDRAGMQVVLVAVDADRKLLGVGDRLEDADAGAAGRRIDYVGAAVHLALGQFVAAGRVAPCGRRGAGHVLEDLGLRIGVLDALLVAGREVADQRD